MNKYIYLCNGKDPQCGEVCLCRGSFPGKTCEYTSNIDYAINKGKGMSFCLDVVGVDGTKYWREIKK